jgi:hypothetical protein
MPADKVTVRFVKSAEEIRRSIATFAADARLHEGLAKELLVQTSYWVFDPINGDFGPSKFVAIWRMNFELYETARSGGTEGARFDGHETRERIEKVLSTQYEPSARLTRALASWAESLFPGSSVFAGVNASKWVFISLPTKTEGTQSPWSSDEVKATVDDYFSMFRAELEGTNYSKSKHRIALQKLLSSRNPQAIEFKHCNISAVLRDMNLVYIAGYKPRGNYQVLLAQAVRTYLQTHGMVRKEVVEADANPVATPPDGSQFKLADIEVPPPSPWNVLRRARPGS